MKESNKKVKMTLQEFQRNEMGPLWEIFDFCTNIPMSIYSDSLGVKVPEACYRSSMWSQNSRLMSEEYLLNAKRSSIDLALPLGVFSYSTLGTRGSLSFRDLLEEEVKQQNITVELPNYMKVNAPLGAIIRSRRSVREMKGDKISLEELSTLLYYGDGVSGDFNHSVDGNEFPSTETLGSKYVSKVRTAPSGGGLYPVYLYVLAINVENTKKGIYKYMPLTHSLEIVKIFNDKDYEELLTIANWGRNIEMDKLGFAVFYIYSLYENSRKYVDMGLTFALIEAGEIAENIHLTSTALNLGSCDIGGYDKVLCEKMLGVDGLTKHLIHLTLIGK